MTDTTAEFPADWFVGAKLSPQKRDPTLNYFGVHASQSLAVWRAKGWIHPDDPRGWFSVVLPLLYWPPNARRRRASGRAVEGHAPAYRADEGKL